MSSKNWFPVTRYENLDYIGGHPVAVNKSDASKIGRLSSTFEGFMLQNDRHQTIAEVTPADIEQKRVFLAIENREEVLRVLGMGLLRVESRLARLSPAFADRIAAVYPELGKYLYELFSKIDPIHGWLNNKPDALSLEMSDQIQGVLKKVSTLLNYDLNSTDLYTQANYFAYKNGFAGDSKVYSGKAVDRVARPLLADENEIAKILTEIKI